MPQTTPKQKRKYIKNLLESQLFFISGIFSFLLFYALYLLREIVVPFFIALLFCFLLAPLVKMLRRFYIPAEIGSALVILFLLLGIGYGCYGVAQPAATWIGKGPEAIETVDLKIRKVADFLATPLSAISQVDEDLNSLSKYVQTNNQTSVSIKQSSFLVGTVATTTWQFLVEVSLTIVILYFLLIYDDFFLSRLVHWRGSLEKKKEVVSIAREVQNNVFKYLFARTVINIGLAVVVTIVMYAFGMPDPLLWGVMAGILEYIPYLGALVSFAVVAVVALFSFASIAYASLVALAFALILFIEGNIIAPIVISRSVMLNPLIIILGLIFWGWLWGVAGAFMSVPLMVTIKIVFETLYEVSFMNEILSE